MAIEIESATFPMTISSTALLAIFLGDRMSHRDWQFRAVGAWVTAHRPEWPAQLCVLVSEPEDAAAVMMGLAVDFGTMPLKGERMREILNRDREELLRRYGSFNLHQLTYDDRWLTPVGHRSFMFGTSDGISRRTQLAVFDTTAGAASCTVERFAEEANRMVETGNQVAGTLQRLYQRTVLSGPVALERAEPAYVR